LRTFLAIGTLMFGVLNPSGQTQDLQKAAPQTAAWKKLYDAHQWFALRDVVAKGGAPPLYRGAVEAAFREDNAAEHDLRKLIESSPQSDDAYEARSILTNLYFRRGSYREAASELDGMLRIKPKAEDALSMRSMFDAFGSLGDQQLVASRASTVPFTLEDGNGYLPLTINGITAQFCFDTGANMSVISEAEAARLGMKLVSTTTRISDSSGSTIRTEVARADDLVIGGLHLKGVVFAVLPDAQEPFVELPLGKRGLIGLPVLLAMQTLRWIPSKNASLGYKGSSFHLADANLAFDGPEPVLAATSAGKSLEMTLDTGAVHTIFETPFAKKFAALLSSQGSKEEHKLTGLAGSKSYSSVVLPSLTLETGGGVMTLAPAHVIPGESTGSAEWADGNLGMDALDQAKTITIDFHAMRVILTN
jgi:tetratricopeptide (TPR) repeat protein